MPELPEVETIKRQLAPVVKKLVFKDIKILKDKLIKGLSPQAFIRQLKGQKILKHFRRAKYLVFELSSSQVLVIHLGMTGSLRISKKIDGKYNKVIFEMSKGYFLIYSDSRMFGRILLLPQFHFELGPEPLGKEFTREIFYEMLKKKNTKIKLLLLDQKFIAGIGNIYACEALFDAGIHPCKVANKISKDQAFRLYDSIRKVLNAAIKAKGSSFSDYVDARGKRGGFQNLVKVYGRGNKPCYLCQGVVKRMNLGQRGTYFCPICQK